MNAANSQANVVAADILAALAAREKSKPTYRNTCWSLLAPGDTVKLGADYAPNGAKLEASGAFISKPGEGADVRRANTEEGEAWYQVIVEDVFANGAKVPAK